MASRDEKLQQFMDERTIAQKFADPNRPTWEQYKKDNADKLNLELASQQEMEAYRRDLDADRERRMKSGASSNKKTASSKHHDDSSSSGSSSTSHRKKRKRKKHSKKHKKHHARDDNDGDDSSSDSGDRKRRRRHHKKHKKRRKDEDADETEAYKLSNFFKTSGEGDDD